MGWLEAAILGILEGLTEFLPVSSTGHLILLGERLVARHDEAAKTLEVVIQLGAVLAVLVHYRTLLLDLARGLARREQAALRLGGALAVGFVPAGLLGLALHRVIKEHLFGGGPVALALIAGGVLMIAVELRPLAPGEEGVDGLEHVTLRRALAVGLAQCFALWPGTSRSMATIVGGRLTGLSTRTAAEFSFLLALPTLGAATLFDLARGGGALLASPGGALALAAGLAAAFAVALAVIAAFLRYLRRFGLMPFGIYRIALGGLVLLFAR